MLETLSAPRSAFSVSRFVESVNSCAPLRGRARRVDRLPDGRTSLVLRVHEGRRQVDLTVIGPRTRALLKDAAGFAQAIELQFRPGWSTPVLGVSASALADAHVPLEDVWGAPARELAHELLAAQDVEDMVDRLARAFAARLDRPCEPASAPLARRAIHLLEGDEVRVDSVATRLGVTARHLRRAFVENIGVGPKDFARSVRLQRALRLAATSPNWARIAAVAGYYDQAHLIGDFRDLIGLTPIAFLKRASEKDPPSPSASTATTLESASKEQPRKGSGACLST